MAAILTDRLFSPRAGSPATDFFPTSRVARRRSIELFGTLKRIWSVTCEGLLLLWMLIVVAFFLLMAAGAVRLPGREARTEATLIVHRAVKRKEPLGTPLPRQRHVSRGVFGA